MIRLNNIQYVLLFLLASFQIVFAQDDNKIKEIFTKSQKVYSSDKELSLAMNYKLFSDYKGTKISEQYEGLCINENKKSYLKIQNMEILQTPSIGVQVNHDQKMIQVIKNKSPKNTQSPIEVSSYLKYFKTKTLTDAGKQFKCTLQSSLYTQLPYGKIEIYINKQTFRIEKQVLYLIEKAAYKDAKGKEKKDFPKLEIILIPVKKEDAFKKKVFDINTYLVIKGDNYTPSKKYSNYTLYKN